MWQTKGDTLMEHTSVPWEYTCSNKQATASKVISFSKCPLMFLIAFIISLSATISIWSNDLLCLTSIN